MMKKLLLSSLFVALQAGAADYAKLKDSFCDAQNKVIYDGAGRFAVESAAETELEFSLDVAALESYLGSNDYKQGPMVTWELSAPDGRKLVYGLADTAKHLTCYWAGSPWEKNGVVSYEKLKSLSVDGKVTLRVKLVPSQGLQLFCGDTQLLNAHGLKTQLPFNTTHAYAVNTNYVTSVSIKSPSSLNTDGYKAPEDYTKVFTRTKEASLGRVMFCGDSITHGVNDQTWRWQLFKILVDNGIEAQIVGPRSGYTPGYAQIATSDAGDSYAGVPFPNVHLAQSSGRTHNIISGSNSGMSGVNYGGHSTKSAAASFNCDTWCCLMGTNDLLSDRGYSPQEFATKMQNLLGGKVSVKGKYYSWTPGADWGNMGRIAADILKEESDILYVMSVPCWGNHANNNEPERHLTVRMYNALLKGWVGKYATAHGKKLVFVDVNKGLVDFSLPVPFSWPDSMSNKPGRDGLHPNEQGSMVIANNLAEAMGIPGRTAGLERASAEAWQAAGKKGAIKGGASRVVQKDVFAREGGYSVELSILPQISALEISLGDEAGSGTLTVTKDNICWGDRPLYCFEMNNKKKRTKPESLRVVWHPGLEGNRPQGYYVWVGDKLVGQALPAGAQAGQGLKISVKAGRVSLSSVKYADTAAAPALEEKP